MKLIFLAAGQSNLQIDNTTPVCLTKYNNDKLILDVLIENFNDYGIDDINVVGGFGFLKIIEKYPELNYYYNSDWKKSKSLASFYKSNSSFNDSLIISYSDVVFKRSALKKIFDNENEIVITFDSKWKNRYEGRTKKFLDESEKVFKCKKSNKLRISNGIKNQDEIIIGESVGIFYIPIHMRLYPF